MNTKICKKEVISYLNYLLHHYGFTDVSNLPNNISENVLKYAYDVPNYKQMYLRIELEYLKSIGDNPEVTNMFISIHKKSDCSDLISISLESIDKNSVGMIFDVEANSIHRFKDIVEDIKLAMTKSTEVSVSANDIVKWFESNLEVLKLVNLSFFRSQLQPNNDSVSLLTKSYNIAYDCFSGGIRLGFLNLELLGPSKKNIETISFQFIPLGSVLPENSLGFSYNVSRYATFESGFDGMMRENFNFFSDFIANAVEKCPIICTLHHTLESKLDASIDEFNKNSRSIWVFTKGLCTSQGIEIIAKDSTKKYTPEIVFQLRYDEKISEYPSFSFYCIRHSDRFSLESLVNNSSDTITDLIGKSKNKIVNLLSLLYEFASCCNSVRNTHMKASLIKVNDLWLSCFSTLSKKCTNITTENNFNGFEKFSKFDRTFEKDGKVVKYSGELKIGKILLIEVDNDYEVLCDNLDWVTLFDVELSSKIINEFLDRCDEFYFNLPVQYSKVEDEDIELLKKMKKACDVNKSEIYHKLDNFCEDDTRRKPGFYPSATPDAFSSDSYSPVQKTMKKYLETLLPERFKIEPYGHHEVGCIYDTKLSRIVALIEVKNEKRFTISFFRYIEESDHYRMTISHSITICNNSEFTELNRNLVNISLNQ